MNKYTEESIREIVHDYVSIKKRHDQPIDEADLMVVIALAEPLIRQEAVEYYAAKEDYRATRR